MSRHRIICYCSSFKFKLSFTCRTKAPGTIHWLTATLAFMLLLTGQGGSSLTLYNCQLMHLPLMMNLIWLYGNTHPCGSSCDDVRGGRWYCENSTFLFVYWQHCHIHLCRSLIFLTTFLFLATTRWLNLECLTFLHWFPWRCFHPDNMRFHSNGAVGLTSKPPNLGNRKPVCLTAHLKPDQTTTSIAWQHSSSVTHTKYSRGTVEEGSTVGAKSVQNLTGT